MIIWNAGDHTLSTFEDIGAVQDGLESEIQQPLQEWDTPWGNTLRLEREEIFKVQNLVLRDGVGWG